MKRTFYIFLMMTAGVLFSCTAKKADPGISVPFEKYTLPNGLTVILHEDKSDPIAAVAVVFHVGSSREVTGKPDLHIFLNT